eukprot:IDg23696t1
MLAAFCRSYPVHDPVSKFLQQLAKTQKVSVQLSISRHCAVLLLSSGMRFHPAALAAELPEHFAQTLAYDIEEIWFLMREYGATQH